MKNTKLSILNWLCVNQNPELANARWLGSFIGAFLFFTIIVVSIVGFLGLYLFLGAIIGIGPYANDASGASVRNLGLALFALFGAPFLIWRSIVAQRQVEVAEQSQITDRINKAVAGLGAEKIVKTLFEKPLYIKDNNGEWLRGENGEPCPALRPDRTPLVDREVHESTQPNLEVRTGSIYALERIAQDSPRDHIQIMEILCAYIRENSPCTDLIPTQPGGKFKKPRLDIQTAIFVIGRRSDDQIKLEWQREKRLDLRNCDFSGIDFGEGDFSAVLFVKSRFEGASFRKCKLHGSILIGSLLNYVNFYDTELKGTRLDFSTINLPKVSNGGMSESLTYAKNIGIIIVGADVSAISYWGETEETNLIFGSKDTRLADNLEFDRKLFDERLRTINKLKNTGNNENLKNAEELAKELYKNKAFVDWVPFNSSDLALSYFQTQFQDRIGLTGWPYR